MSLRYLNFRNKKNYCEPANPQGLSMANVPWGSFCLDCPHVRRMPNTSEQETGYCAAYMIGDWMRGELGLLWDGIKICGVRTEKEPPARRPRFAQRRRMHGRWGSYTTIFMRAPRYAGWALQPTPFDNPKKWPWRGRRRPS
jgi:hypothetical protein